MKRVDASSVKLDLEDARIRHAADSAAGNGFREI